MGRTTVPWKSWVVVCDGGKALILRNEGDTELMNLQLVERLEQPGEPDRELSTDRPGRTQNSPGAGRSAMEETDFHEQAETDFLKDLASKLNERVYAKTIEDFVLVAPPTALGKLRQNFNAGTTDAIRGELPKDLTKLPIPTIEKHLLALKAA
jgi:protein required for attachment to host cells